MDAPRTEIDRLRYCGVVLPLEEVDPLDRLPDLCVIARCDLPLCRDVVPPVDDIEPLLDGDDMVPPDIPPAPLPELPEEPMLPEPLDIDPEEPAPAEPLDPLDPPDPPAVCANAVAASIVAAITIKVFISHS